MSSLSKPSEVWKSNHLTSFDLDVSCNIVLFLKAMTSQPTTKKGQNHQRDVGLIKPSGRIGS